MALLIILALYLGVTRALLKPLTFDLTDLGLKDLPTDCITAYGGWMIALACDA